MIVPAGTLRAVMTAAAAAALLTAGLSCAGQAADPQTWTPPHGTPAPPFGIAEQAGPPTHHVDNTHPGATDAGNPNGSPARPRRTIPRDLPGGSVVVVRGGPYREPSRTTWVGQGTAATPVFIRGLGQPVFEAVERRIEGSYLVVEGLAFDGVAIRLEGDHLSFRGNEVRNFSPGRHSAAIAFEGSDLVFHGNHVHHNGDAQADREIDVHGLKGGTGSLRVWIVDNHIHHNGGDAVQIGGATTEPWARFVYIARNHLHEDRENAVDIKQARDVVISQNEAHDYRPVSSSDGTAIVVHDNPDRVWILFNQIHTSVNGIRNNGSTATWVIGNVIRNIHHDPADEGHDPYSAWAAGAAVLSWRTEQLSVVNNTFQDVDAGVNYPDTWGRLEIVNNIIAGLAQPGPHVGIGRPAVAEASSLHHTLMAGAAYVNWGGRGYTLDAFRAAYPGQCAGCLSADPLLTGPADARLRPASPAVDAGVAHPAYQVFRDLYGVDIARDYAGLPRPLGRGWDLGAFEN